MYYSALIGNPTTHSVSPLMYEEFAKTVLRGSEYKHLKIDVSVDDCAWGGTGAGAREADGQAKGAATMSAGGRLDRDLSGVGPFPGDL